MTAWSEVVKTTIRVRIGMGKFYGESTLHNSLRRIRPWYSLENNISRISRQLSIEERPRASFKYYYGA